jgi:hypothetical protein
MLVQVNPSQDTDTLQIANHELLHIVGFRAIRLTYDGGSISTDREQEGFDLIKGDVQRTGEFQFFNEAFIEIMAEHLITHYWPKNDLLQRYANQYWQMGYETCVPLARQVLSKVGAAYNLDSQEVLHIFAKDYFTGEKGALEMLRSTFGDQGYARLARLQMSHEDAERCARDLNLR